MTIQILAEAGGIICHNASGPVAKGFLKILVLVQDPKKNLHGKEDPSQQAAPKVIPRGLIFPLRLFQPIFCCGGCQLQ